MREHMTWDPTCLFSHSAPCEPFAVILLNQPIADAHQRTVKRLWECGESRRARNGLESTSHSHIDGTLFTLHSNPTTVC